MTQHRARTAGEHGSEVNTFETKTPQTDGVDSWMKAMKSPHRDAVPDARLGAAGIQELMPRND